MITRRPSRERGRGHHGWLDTRHTFSFADYHDPDHMGYRVLRVLNEDRVAPAAGFPPHPHRDFEIISYVIEGALRHQDSTGGGGVIRAGDVQRMSAGRGVVHSEFNASESELVHFIQIWIEPAQRGIAPGYEQKTFPPEEKQGRFRLLVSPDGSQGSLSIHQDVRLFAARLAPGASLDHALGPSRYGWLQVVRGDVRLNDVELRQGDGAALEAEPSLRVTTTSKGEAELLLFDLP
jgi:hypothetical protein